MAGKLKLKPLGGRVIVEPIEQEEMTAGGIILPETAKEKPQEGEDEDVPEHHHADG